MNKYKYILGLLITVPVIYILIVYISFDPISLSLPQNAPTLAYGENMIVYEGAGAKFKYTELDKIPFHCQQAVINLEDRTFYQNIGIDMSGIAREVIAKITNRTTGGSTITQQLVKIGLSNYYQRDLVTQIHEMIYAIKLTSIYSKEEILEMYMNSVYYGNYIYGIGEASQELLGKPVENITVEECNRLVVIPQLPEARNL